MRIDLSQKLKDFSGAEVGTKRLADYLSEFLGQKQDGQSVKLYGIAGKLYTDGAVDLDIPDFDMVKEALESPAVAAAKGQAYSLPVIIRAQILLKMAAAKEADSKE